MGKVAIRSYDPTESLVFLKTKEAFGGLSNMASGYPITVNGTLFLTSEALYQACRFPHLPELQMLITSQTSPMTAKMKIKAHLPDSRKDWLRVRVRIMRWCIRCKLTQNWTKFSSLLESTGTLPIVEQSHKDKFWGAVPSDGKLVGANVLGRLLMELRDTVKNNPQIVEIEPPDVDDFLLFGKKICSVPFKEANDNFRIDSLF
ncbi:NADAR family protein [Pseudomonas fluorescens]|uniref:NADAR family protein n=1 Tax=Pseudomonas fluorescens TaxID=294 RepID=UPI001CA77E0E|nr:NADAR family protein [Pseudomonas fluorescens]MBY8934858.1 NADAR family protein [Pseudomonas fluorescens]